MLVTRDAPSTVNGTPPSRSAAASWPSRNGLPPVAARHARAKHPVGSVADDRRNAATPWSLSGASSSTSSAGSERANAKGPSAGARSSTRAAATSASGSDSTRRTRNPKKRSDGSSAHCRSSSTINVGRSAVRFATSQKRPWSVPNGAAGSSVAASSTTARRAKPRHLATARGRAGPPRAPVAASTAAPHRADIRARAQSHEHARQASQPLVPAAGPQRATPSCRSPPHPRTTARRPRSARASWGHGVRLF
jgi:hypothetical protein